MLTPRRVFVHSSARARAAAAARAKKLDRARDDLERLGRGLGSRHYPDADAVATRIATIARERRVGLYLRTEVGTDPETGKPTLSWRLTGVLVSMAVGAFVGDWMLSHAHTYAPVLPAAGNSTVTSRPPLAKG